MLSLSYMVIKHLSLGDADKKKSMTTIKLSTLVVFVHVYMYVNGQKAEAKQHIMQTMKKIKQLRPTAY